MPVTDQTPDVMLYDSNGVEMAVANGVAIPLGTRGLLSAGSDGTNARFVLVDASGRQIAVGAAASGAAAVGNPLLVAGADVSSAVRPIRTTTDGTLIVAPTGSDKTNGQRAGLVTLGGGTVGALVPVRGTTYNEQTVNAQRSVASANANDTAAGTGARSVTITYYDATGAGPFTETVVLNGLTAVATANSNICFIESIVVATVGSGGANAGILTLYVNNAGGGGTIGTIGVGTIVAAVGDNRTLWAHHYVASNLTCAITSYIVGASGTVTFHLRSKNPTNVNAPDIAISPFLTTAGEFSATFPAPITVPGPARITAYAVPSANNLNINGAIGFYE